MLSIFWKLLALFGTSNLWSHIVWSKRRKYMTRKKPMTLSWVVWYSLTEDKYVLTISLSWKSGKNFTISRETAWCDQIILFFLTNMNCVYAQNNSHACDSNWHIQRALNEIKVSQTWCDFSNAPNILSEPWSRMVLPTVPGSWKELAFWF